MMRIERIGFYVRKIPSYDSMLIRMTERKSGINSGRTLHHLNTQKCDYCLLSCFGFVMIFCLFVCLFFVFSCVQISLFFGRTISIAVPLVEFII